MIVRFWGVRGSIATPGASHLRYGGNTCCLTVEGGGELIVLDAGTGFCQLNDTLLDGPLGRGTGRLTLLLSQTHLDHMLGFPFAGIVHHPGNQIVIYGPGRPERSIRQIYEHFLGPAYTPFHSIANMGATHEFRQLDEAPFQLGAFHVQARPMVHGQPDIWGYRLQHNDRIVCYLSDTAYPDRRPSAEALALAQGAHLLIHGASFMAHEQRSEISGCSVEEAIAVAELVGATRLLLCHHAPWRTDDAIDALLEHYRHRLTCSGSSLWLDAAREGATLEV